MAEKNTIGIYKYSKGHFRNPQNISKITSEGKTLQNILPLRIDNY